MGASPRGKSSSRFGRLGGVGGAMPWPKVEHGGGCIIGVPPILSLGTTNIMPFMEGLIFTRAYIWSLGIGMGMC